MNDLIHLAMRRAVESFGGQKDKMFNAANFSRAFTQLAGVESNLDGRIVEAMLCGRPDVKQLAGGSHHLLIEPTAP